MPNKKSAEKRVRQAAKRRLHNRAARSAMRRQLRKANEAVAQVDAEAIKTEIAAAHSKLGKAAKTGLIKKNNASRKISRLMKAAHRAQQQAAAAE